MEANLPIPCILSIKEIHVSIHVGKYTEYTVLPCILSWVKKEIHRFHHHFGARSKVWKFVWSWSMIHEQFLPTWPFNKKTIFLRRAQPKNYWKGFLKSSRNWVQSVLQPRGACILPETNRAPENGPFQKENSLPTFSNHHFSGVNC